MTRRTHRWNRIGLLVLILALGPAVPGSSAADSFLLVVSGLGGDPEYQESFLSSALELRSAALAAGLEDRQITVLAEDSEVDSVEGRSDKETVLVEIDRIVEQSRPGDAVWIVLIGHGSFRDGRSRINLPGPDLTDADFAGLVDRLDGRQVVFVNASSASGGFLETMAGEGRVVVTATKSASQRNESLFAGFFSAAFVANQADENRDERVSVGEAFRYATREVARHYETENLLLTELAMLDDNGDGEGTNEPDPLGGTAGSGDGRLAERIFLAPLAQPSSNPEVVALRDERAVLGERLDALRRQKASMEQGLYLAELQRLLVEIARLDRRLRELEGSSDEESASSNDNLAGESQNARVKTSGSGAGHGPASAGVGDLG